MSGVGVEKKEANTIELPREIGSMTDKRNGVEAPGQSPLAEQIKGVMASALDAIVQSASTDQLRGYANEAIGETKLNIGLAVGSPELILLGIAQKSVGQVQRYIGEAKLAVEADLAETAPVAEAVQPCQDLPSVGEGALGVLRLDHVGRDKPSVE